VIIISNKHLDLIINTPLLHSVAREHIKAFLSTNKFQVAYYKKNSVVHFDGEPCDKLEIILYGKVIVDRIDESGKLLTILDFRDGDILGVNLMFSTTPYYLMTLTTHIDTLILEISKELIFELLSTNKEFLKIYLEFVSNNTSLLGSKIKYYVKRSIRENIITYLNHEYKLQNNYEIKLSMSKKSLAERIGAERTSLSRELRKMKDEGLITYNNKYITVLDKKLIYI